MPTIQIYLNSELDQKIKEKSKDDNVSKHDVILRILEDYKFKKDGK